MGTTGCEGNYCVGCRAGSELHVAQCEEGTRILLSLLLYFTDRHCDSVCAKPSPYVFKSLPRAHSASAVWLCNTARTALCNAARMALLDRLGLYLTRGSVSPWDKSWHTRSVVKAWPTRLRGWIHVVPFLLPVAIFFLRDVVSEF